MDGKALTASSNHLCTRLGMASAPVLASADLWALALSASAIVAIFRFKLRMITTLLACSGISIVSLFDEDHPMNRRGSTTEKHQ